MKCSGLEVCRYEPAEIAAELGPAFRLRDGRRSQHVTPAGKTQSFCFGVLQRVSP